MFSSRLIDLKIGERNIFERRGENKRKSHDVLCKVDRASMSCSLETRAPYLDPDVIEIATRIPLDFKIHSGLGKQTLRSILDDF